MSVSAIKKIKTMHIIINPASGKEEPVLALLGAALKDSGLRWEFLITKKAGDARRFAKEAVKMGVDAVAACGGDGTQMEVACGLMGTDVPLVVLPGGSANVLATELNIPKDLKEALALATGSHEVLAVDMAKYDGSRYYITGMAYGFGADLIKDVDRKTKSRFGILAYFFSAASVLKRLRILTYDLKVDGKSYRIKGLACLVYNVGSLGFIQIPLARKPDVSDGLLDVIIVRKVNLCLLWLILRAMLRHHQCPDNHGLVEQWQGRDIQIKLSRRQKVQCDGELIEQIPHRIRVVPGAVRIVVPKKKGKSGA